MDKVKLNQVKQGDWVRLIRKGAPAGTIWQRNHYDRATKSYSLTDINDVNREIFRKASTIVFLNP